jgi:Putative helicase
MFKSFFNSRPDKERSDAIALAINPAEMLSKHRKAITAMRLESGWEEKQFELLVVQVFKTYAAFVGAMPASQSENHREDGGLFRLVVESAAIALRRADGKFFSGPATSDANVRSRDKAWRYAAFLGAPLLAMARSLSSVEVSSGAKGVWCPWAEGIVDWIGRENVRDYRCHWAIVEASTTKSLTLWLAGRLVHTESIDYLKKTDPRAIGAWLRALEETPNGESMIGRVIEESYQAAVDQDLKQLAKTSPTSLSGYGMRYQMLDVMRSLVREKWSLENHASPIVRNGSHYYLVWNAAATDIATKLSSSQYFGMPREPDTLAEILLNEKLIDLNSEARKASHLFEIVSGVMKGPTQTVEAVRLSHAELIGIKVSSLTNSNTQVISAPRTPSTNSSAGDQNSYPESVAIVDNHEMPTGVTQPSHVSAPVKVSGSAKTDAVPSNGQQSLIANEDGGSVAPERKSATKKFSVVDAEERMKLYGIAGKTIARVAEHFHAGLARGDVFVVDNGIVVRFPQGTLASVCDSPRDFLAECEKHSLAVFDRGGRGKPIWNRKSEPTEWPEKFIVLSPILRFIFDVEQGAHC